MDQCAIYMSIFWQKLFNYSLKEIILHRLSFYIAAPPHLHCVSGEKKKSRKVCVQEASINIVFMYCGKE